jgi:site-specific DNA recombinase
MFELYATGEFSLAQLVKATRQEFGCSLAKGYVHKLLMYPFYRGKFEWRWVMYLGKQERIIPALVCEQVDAVLHRANRPRYEKHRFAFAGLLTCAHDGCIVTAETKKQKYTYYHCTGYRGRCDLPYMREESLGQSLGSILDGIYIPQKAIQQIVESRENAAHHAAEEREREVVHLGRSLKEIRRKKQQTYEDKLNGAISEEFWRERHIRWTEEESILANRWSRLMQPISQEQQLTMKRILELANSTPALYQTQNPDQQAQLLKMIVSNCRTDGVNHWPVYRKPFNPIFERAKTEEWCARVPLV